MDATGRTAIRRRRLGTVATAVAVVGLISVGSFAIQRLARSTADQPASLPLPATSAAALGLDLLSGNIIQRPDGSNVTLALPDGTTTFQAWTVPGGWLLNTSNRTWNELWFAPASGPPHPIGRVSGGHALSADGRLLVVVKSEPSETERLVAVAYELPSLVEVGRRALDLEGLGIEAGTFVIGVSGERVLLRSLKVLPGWPSAAVWNRRAGSLTGSTVEVLSMSGNGQVLYYVIQPRSPAPQRTGPGGTPLPPDSPLPPFCMTMATLGDVMSATDIGFCSADYALRQEGTLSPDGLWAAMTLDWDNNTLLVRTADLQAGRWHPVTVDLPDGMRLPLWGFWDTNETFVAWGVEGDRTTDRIYVRCHVSGQCGSVNLPPELHDAKLVQRVGG